MEPVLTWIKSANLIGTARFFGGNMKPMPSGEGKPYGYGFCASIPESVTIPEYLKEMTLPGGLYAVIESTDDIEVSWKTLMKHLSSHEKYKSDRSRLCLEEHIRNDNPEGCGNEYSLRLMEPVKLK
ncbi:effector binding domain-containing protein [Anaerocolumna aminovalerica]|uniref:effector binding domain-containing protein n=1 Tax=Anaerocolumna aminovalerica TaxID=1527 RepID=UPI001C0EF675|nr:effector binding domain-containing protein [Anaerocolumna aminovalerica]MBU5334447.1 effector binding domain-containing protein [Anaerocolumna aminovalerica]